MGTVCVKGEKTDKNQPISEISSQRVQGIEISIQKGDIVELKVDAIVNPCDQKSANQLLKSAGTKVEEEISKQKDIPKGKAFITEAGNLQAKHLIHVNLASWQGIDEAKEIEKMKESFDSILQVAADNKITTLGFPDMFSGIFVAPIQIGSHVLLEKMIQFCNEKPNDVNFEKFIIISQDQSKLKAYANELEKLTLNLKDSDEQKQKSEKQKEVHEEKPKEHLPPQNEEHKHDEPPKEQPHEQQQEPPKQQEELPKEQPHQPQEEPPKELLQQQEPPKEQLQQNQEELPQQHNEPPKEELQQQEAPKEEPQQQEEPPKEEAQKHEDEPPKEENKQEEPPKEESQKEQEEPPKEENKQEEPKEENQQGGENPFGDKTSYDVIKSNEEKEGEGNEKEGKEEEIVLNEEPKNE